MGSLLKWRFLFLKMSILAPVCSSETFLLSCAAKESFSSLLLLPFLPPQLVVEMND